MSGAGVDCALVCSLLGAWRDGDLPDAEREPFEQHLLVCPPCLDLKDNLQIALDALARVIAGEGTA